MKITIEKADLDKLVQEAFIEGSLIDDDRWYTKAREIGSYSRAKIRQSFFEESEVFKKSTMLNKRD